MDAASRQEVAFLRAFTTTLLVLGMVGLLLWTFVSALLAGENEGESCADAPRRCNDTAEFIGLGLPVWIAFALIAAACVLAYRRHSRPAWLLILASFAPLVLIPLPHADYAVNSYLLTAWFLAAVLAGAVGALVLALLSRR